MSFSAWGKERSAEGRDPPTKGLPLGKHPYELILAIGSRKLDGRAWLDGVLILPIRQEKPALCEGLVKEMESAGSRSLLG